ncbi:hypothetical protein ACHAXR_005739 [Thalassiosira sp. AJA248-18]
MAKQQPTPSSSESIDVVWLKKDVRLHDHAPLSLIAASASPRRRCIILYLYEPDQLSEKTVHGSHIGFINEGLVDLDLRLSGQQRGAAVVAEDSDIILYQHQFQCLTVAHAGAAFTLQTLHRQCPINQILCHMESSHLKSFARDKAVRRWCRANSVPIKEFNQTGVTRCLFNRDDFSTNFNRFLDQPMPKTPTAEQLLMMRRRLIDIDEEGIRLHGICKSPIKPSDIQEIPLEHRSDRAHRQNGGEDKALDLLQSFLSRRGANYSSGISSPNTSWTTGSRLSPYLTWGHISLRYVIVTTKTRQEELRAAKKASSVPTPWLRSLASFQSRMHWRSHFLQKLETQPSLEKQDQCLAFSHLRRQPNDFCQEHFDAWCEGRTGFPFVDASMRCLIQCGWLNFRMRAMLVSFATYNLWMDWKRIAAHLARVFLDYEPGIHYPQLQMQAGTTGINAMRVYNVTKQGKDQDPNGVFIRKYVPELQNVPNEYIHEPQNMPVSVQRKCRVFISNGESKGGSAGLRSIFQPIEQSTTGKHDPPDTSDFVYYYPSPIVDEKSSAKTAKDQMAAVRKQENTKTEAEQVLTTHGSRRSRSADRDGAKPKALSSAVKRVKVDKGQRSLLNSWKAVSPEQPIRKDSFQSQVGLQKNTVVEQSTFSNRSGSTTKAAEAAGSSPSMEKFLIQKEVSDTGLSKTKEWSCKMCTYLNEKPWALACSICGSERQG